MLKSILRSAAIAFSLAAAGAAYAAAFNDAQKKEIGEVVRQYLLENPELLRELKCRARTEKRSWRKNAVRKEALTPTPTRCSAAMLTSSPATPRAMSPWSSSSTTIAAGAKRAFPKS
ncbi:MAG: hypothetical protein HC855_14880 [Rhizobiales bacterium]|nr:hypothetical protein [Hyphomicrobiales bacterium]